MTGSGRPGAAAVVWGFGVAEVLLARVSDQPQTTWDLAVGLVPWVAVGSALALAERSPRLAPLARFAPWLLLPGAAASMAALALSSPRPEALAVGVVAAAAVTLAGVAAWDRLGPGGRLAPVGGWLALAAAATTVWAVREGRVPVEVIGAHLSIGLVLGAVGRAAPAGLVAWALAPALALVPRLADGPPSGGPAWGGAPSDLPDLVLVTVDTLRADAGAATASFGRVGAAGRLFEDVQATSTWTLPTLSSLHTGQEVHTHGAIKSASGKSRVGPELPMLAERLAARGYATAGVIARNRHADPSFGFDRGMDWFDFDGSAAHWKALPSSADRVGRPLWVQAALVGASRTRSGALRAISRYASRGDDAVVVERAIALLRTAPADRPLFLWVHLMDPHMPYNHADALPALDPATRAALPWFQVADVRRDAARWAADPEPLRVAYQHEVALADEAVTTLLDALEHDRSRPRVVALTADHGEEFFEHGGFEHGHTFHGEVTSVPLAISGVDVPEGRRWVDQIDVAATLLAAAGAPHDDLPGRPLTEPDPEVAPLWTVSNLLDADAAQRAAVRAGDWKLIVGERESLFDRATDPGERVDLADRWPERVRALAAGVRADPTGTLVPVELSSSQQKELEALGYIE